MSLFPPSKIGVERPKRRDRPIGIEESSSNGTIRRNISISLNSLILLQPRHDIAQKRLLCFVRTSGLEIINPDRLAIGDLGGIIDAVLETLLVARGGDVEPVESDEADVAAKAVAGIEELREIGEILRILKVSRCAYCDTCLCVWLHLFHPESGSVLCVHVELGVGGAGLAKVEEIFLACCLRLLRVLGPFASGVRIFAVVLGNEVDSGTEVGRAR